MPALHIVKENNKISDCELKEREISIGRTFENHIVLDDSSVSRKHARLSLKGKHYILSDLGSHNGIIVNGKFVQRVKLKDGDRIQIGRNTLTFYKKIKPETLHKISDDIFSDGDPNKIGQQTIIKSREDSCPLDSQELLLDAQATIVLRQTQLNHFSKSPSNTTDLISLERNNKVLFVLYEISKQLNSISDFKELLKKIMDLIFVVISADYGYLILTENHEEEKFVPVVFKQRDDHIGEDTAFKASRTIIEKVIKDKVALLSSNTMSDTRLDPSESLISQKIRSVICVPLWKQDEIIGVIQLDSVKLENQFTKDDLELLNAIGCQIAMIIEQASLQQHLREEKRLISRLGRFLSPQVIDMILKGGEDSKKYLMDPHNLDVTILFADIVGFTSFSEQMEPEEINMLLNRFYTRMSDVIFKYEGTLDKFLGDGLMAIFGAPVKKKDHAERAIRTALNMQTELELMMKEAAPENRFKMRIGVNSGRVVAGNVGSPMRMDYTVIGDPVNVASRLVSMAEPNKIYIGEVTYKSIKDKFKTRKIGLKKVKGKRNQILVCEIINQNQ